MPTAGSTTAQNLKLYSGELRPWLKPLLSYTPTKPGTLKSMYRMYTTNSSSVWNTWVDDVDAVRGPIAGDTAFKLYYSGDLSTAAGPAGPRKTNLALSTGGTGSNYPNDYLEMGVPAPGSPPAVVGTGGTSTNSVTRIYVYTYVTSTASWAEEGPPSPLGTGTGKADATWVISGLSTGTTGKYAFDGGVKRIYRTLTDSNGATNFQLALDNVPMASTSTADTTTDANLGVICPSFTPGVVGSEWVAPPSDMHSLIGLPNGMMAGLSGNIVCFCEPYRPHAWPLRYRLALNFRGVGLGAYGNTLIAVTDGFPYAIVGPRPDSMIMARIEELHPCVSKRGVVSFPYGVAWPTSDGLAISGAGETVNAIKEYMTRDEWRAQCFPASLIAHAYQDSYFGFFTGSLGATANFVFDKTNKQGPLVFGNYGVTGVWNDPSSAKLYIIQNNKIYEWDADTLNKAPFDWKSKTFITKDVNYGAIQVDADYSAIADNAVLTTASAFDLAVNMIILGTGSFADTAQLVAWSASSSYGTGDVRRSVNGVMQIICTVAGTSSSTEPAYPGTLGGTATDGTVEWKRIWELEGRTKGSLRGQVMRDHTQWTTSDPPVDGTAGNQWGFPIRGSLLQGGTYADYDNRYLQLRVYALTTYTTSSGDSMTLIATRDLVNRNPIRLPSGFKSDTWEIRISGNISVRYFRIAETMRELDTV